MRVATSHLQQRVVLVGHSGAGLLLPVIADDLDVEVAGLVFVDSRLPPPASVSLLGNPVWLKEDKPVSDCHVRLPAVEAIFQSMIAELEPLYGTSEP